MRHHHTHGAALLLGLFASGGMASPPDDCEGCVSSGGAGGSASSGSLSVSISAMHSSGACVGCAPDCVGSPCEVSIDREWINIPEGTEVDHCSRFKKLGQQQNPWECEDPAPKAGSAPVETSNRTDTVPCGKKKVYKVEVLVPPTTLKATTSVECSKCE